MINTFLSFLKRERERFPLFVPVRYCVPARTFISVPDRSPFMIVFINVPWSFLNVPWTFSTSSDLFKARKSQKRSWNVQKRSRRWTRRGDEWSEAFILYKINGLKRLQNLAHRTFNRTLQKRKKNRIEKMLYFIYMSNTSYWNIYQKTILWQINTLRYYEKWFNL